jgi:hypothetical protein
MNIEELTERTEKVAALRKKLIDFILEEAKEMSNHDVLWVGITTFAQAARSAAEDEDAFKNLVKECVQIGRLMAESGEDITEAESATKH